MKLKLTLLAIIALLAARQAGAQDLNVFGGLNISRMKHRLNGASQESKSASSYQVGLGVVLPLNRSYYKDKDGSEVSGIYPSLQYIRKGVKKTTLIDPMNSDIRLGYLQFTVPAYYRLADYGIGLGPYAAYAVSGKTEYTSLSSVNRKIDFGKDLKRLDYGLSLTMDISIFYLQYDFGLANLGTGKYGTAKNRTFSVGLLIPLVQMY